MSNLYPDLNAPSGGFVFLVTYGRSGSTLVQNLLNDIPGYCIRGENANTLLHLVQAWMAIERAEPVRGARNLGAVTEPHHPWYGAELQRPADYARSLADVFTREVLRLPANTRVGGFKEIRFHTEPALFLPYMTFLSTFFPKARFVFNTRSHATVAKSGWWAKLPPDRVATILTSAETLFDSWIARNPARCIKLHYDDYNGQPEAMRPLFDFLGEKFNLDRVAALLSQRLTHLQPSVQ